MEHWVYTLAVLRRSEDRIMLPDKYVSKVANELDAPLKGRVFYVTGPAILKRSQGIHPTIRTSRSYHLQRQNRAGVARRMARRSAASNCGPRVCTLSKRLSTTRAARRAVAVRTVGRSLAFARRALPRLRVQLLVVFHATWKRRHEP